MFESNHPHFLWRNTNKVQNHYHETVSQSFVTFQTVSWRYAERICFLCYCFRDCLGQQAVLKGIVNHEILWHILYVSRDFFFPFSPKFKFYLGLFSHAPCHIRKKKMCILSCIKSLNLQKMLELFLISGQLALTYAANDCESDRNKWLK